MKMTPMSLVLARTPAFSVDASFSDHWEELKDKILESSVDNGINIIDLDNHSKGVYFIKINSDEGVTSRKIIIE